MLVGMITLKDKNDIRNQFHTYSEKNSEDSDFIFFIQSVQLPQMIPFLEF